MIALGPGTIIYGATYQFVLGDVILVSTISVAIGVMLLAVTDLLEVVSKQK